MMILLEYLTDTAVAPLQREFVELSEPYCSNVRLSFNCIICDIKLHFLSFSVVKR